MTDKAQQFRFSIDKSLSTILQEMKISSPASSRGNLPTYQKLILAKLTKLHREVGYEKIIFPSGLNDSMPNVYAPPNARGQEPVYLSIRLSDTKILQSITDLSKMTQRPVSQIIYTLLRYVVSEWEAEHAIAKKRA